MPNYVASSYFFQQQRNSVMLKGAGNHPPLVLSGLTTLCVDSPELFANVTDDCHHISSNSCRYSKLLSLRMQIIKTTCD